MAGDLVEQNGLQVLFFGIVAKSYYSEGSKTTFIEFTVPSEEGNFTLKLRVRGQVVLPSGLTPRNYKAVIVVKQFRDNQTLEALELQVLA